MSARAYLPPDAWEAEGPRLSREETHHLHRVLRVGPKDEFEVMDGRGRTARARIAGIEGHCARLDWTSDPEQRRRPAPAITLFPAHLKSRGMDWLMEKATELGAARVVPVHTLRSVAAPKATQVRKQMDRWRRITVSAAKQCGIPWLPALDAPLPFADLPAAAAQCGLFLAPLLRPGTRPIADVMAGQAEPPATVAVAIGPEGDYTDDEEQQLIEAGATPVSLGPNVLRAETAALAALAVTSAHFTRDS